MNKEGLVGRDIRLSAINKKKHTEILKRVDFTAKPGRLTAIMGESGCGKTSLLKVITGKIDNSYISGGQVLYNGKNRNESYLDTYAALDHESVLFGNKSVFEYLKFNTAGILRDRTEEQIEEAVESVIENVHLTKTIGTSLKDLSAGEQKRVLLAETILSERKILILDEPISALDSHLALEIIKYIKNLAVEKNLVLIVTIHQPSRAICEFFDDFVFIYNGLSIYSGPYLECEEFYRKLGFENSTKFSFVEYIFLLGSPKTTMIEVSELERFRIMTKSIEVKKIEKSIKSRNIAKKDSKISFSHSYELYKKYYNEIFSTKKDIRKFLMNYILILSCYLLYYAKIFEDLPVIKEIHQNVKFLNFHFLVGSSLYGGSFILFTINLSRMERTKELSKSNYTINELIVAVFYLFSFLSFVLGGLVIGLVVLYIALMSYFGDKAEFILLVKESINFFICQFLFIPFDFYFSSIISVITNFQLLADCVIGFAADNILVFLNFLEFFFDLEIVLKSVEVFRHFYNVFYLLLPNTFAFVLIESITTKIRPISLFKIQYQKIKYIESIGIKVSTYLILYPIFGVFLYYFVYKSYKNHFSRPIRLLLEKEDAAIKGSLED